MRIGPIHLRGWKQILAGLLVLLAAYGGYTVWIQSGLDAKLRKLMEARLKTDLHSEAAARHLSLSQSTTAPAREQANRFEAEATKVAGLKVISVSKRGLGGTVVVRAKFGIDGKPLAKGEDTRYYRLKFSWITGWYVYSKTSEFSYRVAWF